MQQPQTTQGQVGNYIIERELARGAMGVVYVAHHHLTEAQVALKVLQPTYITDTAAYERFRREVSAAARIGHPGIVQVFDAGRTEDGSLFLAMELLQGADLEQYVRSPEVNRVQLLDWIGAMLAPLAAAHAVGIVHRDLKPANVFLAQDHTGAGIKLLDFGVAKETQGGANATATGMAIGTPAFMSPEQSQDASRICAASDVWALGVMLYQVLTGRYPFEGQMITAIIVAACTQDHVKVTALSPEIPQDLSDLVDHCLEKEPEDRPADAAAVAALLAPILLRAEAREALSGPRVIPQSSAPTPSDIAPQASGVRNSAPGMQPPSVQLPRTVAMGGDPSYAVSRPTAQPMAQPEQPSRSGLWLGLGIAAVALVVGAAVAAWSTTGLGSSEEEAPVAEQTAEPAPEPSVVEAPVEQPTPITPVAVGEAAEEEPSEEAEEAEPAPRAVARRSARTQPAMSEPEAEPAVDPEPEEPVATAMAEPAPTPMTTATASTMASSTSTRRPTTTKVRRVRRTMVATEMDEGSTPFSF